MNTYTQLSQQEYDNIRFRSITAEEAFSYLQSGITPRNFSDTLAKFYAGEDLKERLIERLLEYNPGSVRDSISKKVRGWLNGGYEPSDRETVLQICFALDLDENSANEFLGFTSDCTIHYRNPRELSYAFALRTGMGYADAVKLYESLPPIPESKETSLKNEKVYTETIFNDFYKVKTPLQFKEFINTNLDNLGRMHNTAFYYFKTMIDCLKAPDEYLGYLFDKDEDWKKSEVLSIEAITERYLRMNVPSGASKGKATPVEKLIKQYWPSATSIKCMCSRTEDIKRKVLILLYIITEGIADDVNWSMITDEDQLSPEELFEEHFDRICIMLYDCGMALPDPRNLFDWVALYSIKMNHDEAMSDELQAILSRIFNTETNTTDNIEEGL